MLPASCTFDGKSGNAIIDGQTVSIYHPTVTKSCALTGRVSMFHHTVNLEALFEGARVCVYRACVVRTAMVDDYQSAFSRLLLTS